MQACGAASHDEGAGRGVHEAADGADAGLRPDVNLAHRRRLCHRDQPHPSENEHVRGRTQHPFLHSALEATGPGPRPMWHPHGRSEFDLLPICTLHGQRVGPHAAALGPHDGGPFVPVIACDRGLVEQKRGFQHPPSKSVALWQDL